MHTRHYDEDDATRTTSAASDAKRVDLSPEELAKLKELDPQTFEALPPSGGRQFSSDFKNPCWREGAGGGGGEGEGGALRCLPYYYVIGGWQCGGQALQAALSGHPDVSPEGRDAQPALVIGRKGLTTIP